MTDTTAHAEVAHEEHVGHAADAHYARIAIALAFITALEVAVSYLGLPIMLEIAILLTLMAIKFFTVAAQFMHLKFDNKILTRLFYGGLFLATGVYLIALSTFRIWNI
jgi:cytochrome c oxidase subunit IV